MESFQETFQAPRIPSITRYSSLFLFLDGRKKQFVRDIYKLFLYTDVS